MPSDSYSYNVYYKIGSMLYTSVYGTKVTISANTTLEIFLFNMGNDKITYYFTASIPSGASSTPTPSPSPAPSSSYSNSYYGGSSSYTYSSSPSSYYASSYAYSSTPSSYYGSSYTAIPGGSVYVSTSSSKSYAYDYSYSYKPSNDR